MKKLLRITLAALALSATLALGVTQASANNGQCTDSVTQGGWCE